jgi:hypothetical protein
LEGKIRETRQAQRASGNASTRVRMDVRVSFLLAMDGKADKDDFRPNKDESM